MNLRRVHAGLILLSAILAVVFGIWCLGHYRRDRGVRGVGRPGGLRLVVPAQDEVASMIRLRSYAATARQALATLAAMMVGSASVLACPVCFGAADNNGLIDGARLGVVVLVGITLIVQGAFVGFFIYLRRRARRMADDDLETEWFELQRGSRPS
jgi:hypothetical protein